MQATHTSTLQWMDDATPSPRPKLLEDVTPFPPLQWMKEATPSS